MDYSQLLFILLLVAVFWFVVIRPQQQRTKQQKAMLEALKPGDEIVTIGGVYATVVGVGERVRVRVVDGSELEFARQAVSRVVPPSEVADQIEPEAPAVEESEEKSELDA